MSKARMIKSVISEYGLEWLANRTLYCLKLKLMGMAPSTESWFEKRTVYPRKLDIFQVDVNALGKFIQGLDEQDKKKLIEIADKASDGIITGFSSIELNYGNPIDWQLNPLTGVRCDEKRKWYMIPDFDNERGDIKVIWEASRFSHFIILTRAYLLTGNVKYYNAFSYQLKDWLKKNPYNFGANFKCSQECSLRMINALLAYTVFNASGIATDADESNIKDLIDRCYRKILSNFFYAYKCIKNNHTISELMGMIVGAWCCDEQKELEKAYRFLEAVIDEQFTEDGGYRQFSFNYQRLALQDLEVVMSVAGKTGKSLSSRSLAKIRNSAFLLFQCQDDSGDVPNYGSNDGALVFPVTSCGYRDFRPVINTAYALSAGKQLYKNGKHQEELIWFIHGKNLEDFKIEPEERISVQLTDAGLFTIRGDNSWLMLVSNDYTSRPAHMDHNHIDLWINGINVFCDAGTYSYASEEGRNFARNESHNTIVVDGCAQMNASGPFMIYDWTKRVIDYCDNKSFAGRMISLNGYEHVREVKQIDDSYIITDTCNKNFCVYFHTPCNIEKNGKGIAIKHGERVLCLVESNGEIKLNEARRSLYYLKKDVTTCMKIYGHEGTKIITKIKIQ